MRSRAVLSATLDPEREHAELLALLAAFRDAVAAGRRPAELVPIFEQALDFARLHFRHEEQVMAQAGYPGLAAHRAEHDRLLAEVTERLLRLRAGNAAAPVAACRYLENGLQQHFESADKACYRYLHRSTIRAGH
ncbi:MAG: hemerythrin family protein [Nevskia sp.]|nr:hemerythrin family protein [Nevskia sp.]